MSNKPAKYIASFGRRKGHKLRPSRAILFETLLPTIEVAKPQGAIAAASLFGNDNPLWFELGFGGGEHLAEQALRNPHINFIGCEPYINGISSLLVAIDEHKLSNVRVYGGDARDILDNLPDGSIGRMFILFPDPWPKARHHKRRIVNQTTLSILHQKLKEGALLRVATDHVDYCTWILEHFLLFNKFLWQASRPADWHDAPADWVPTRYQAKAEQEGRKAVFLDFIK